MAQITIRFYSLWRLYLGTDRLCLTADRLEEALAQVDERFGARLREQLRERGVHVVGEMQDYSLVLLNGCSVSRREEAPLKEGDIVQFFPPAAGG